MRQFLMRRNHLLSAALRHQMHSAFIGLSGHALVVLSQHDVLGIIAKPAAE